MGNEDYKTQRKQFILYIIVAILTGMLFIYLALKNRLPIKKDGIIIEPKLDYVKLIAGIILLIGSILFTGFLIWLDKKAKSVRK